MKVTRRKAIGILTAGVMAEQTAGAQASTDAVTLRWLGDEPPLRASGVSWGVPFARGTLTKSAAFTLAGSDGKALPLQSWQLAYWPDGSMKWIGFATVAGPGVARELRLSAGSSRQSAGLKVQNSADAVEIDTGKLQCSVPHAGHFLIGSMKMEAREVARQGRLICTLEDSFTSAVKGVTVEQSGPVRAVIKIEGLHKAERGDRE
jgi:hypothetical protein